MTVGVGTANKLLLQCHGRANRMPSQGSQRANQPLLNGLRELPGSAAAVRVLVSSSARFLGEGLEHTGHQSRRRRIARQVGHAARNRTPRFFEVGPTNDDLALVAEIQTQWVHLFCDQRHGRKAAYAKLRPA